MSFSEREEYNVTADEVKDATTAPEVEEAQPEAVEDGDYYISSGSRTLSTTKFTKALIFPGLRICPQGI